MTIKPNPRIPLSVYIINIIMCSIVVYLLKSFVPGILKMKWFTGTREFSHQILHLSVHHKSVLSKFYNLHLLLIFHCNLVTEMHIKNAKNFNCASHPLSSTPVRLKTKCKLIFYERYSSQSFEKNFHFQVNKQNVYISFCIYACLGLLKSFKFYQTLYFILRIWEYLN